MTKIEEDNLFHLKRFSKEPPHPSYISGLIDGDGCIFIRKIDVEFSDKILNYYIYEYNKNTDNKLIIREPFIFKYYKIQSFINKFKFYFVLVFIFIKLLLSFIN